MSARWDASGPFRFGVGIEDTFIPHELPGRRKLDEYELTQHYVYWEQDLELVAGSGADTIRWGIPWYLVEPERGRFAWDWVDEVADKIASLGLTCVVDLMHYGTPLWLEQSFLDPAYPDHVAAYAGEAAARYRGVFTAWTPLNEPMINAVYCGQRGLWPPYQTGESGLAQVTMQLAKGICLTEQAVRAAQPDPVLVHVDAGFRYEGDTHPLPRDLMLELRFLALDLVTGRVDGQHPLSDWLARQGARDDDLSWLRRAAVTPDVIGVNYYPAFTTVRVHPDGRTEPVEAGTAGLEELVRDYDRRYRRPLMITETSRGGPVDERRQWLSESLGAVGRLRREGIPLIGYTWFPFLALVDWLYREDTAPADDWLIQMGLVDLSRVPGGGRLDRRPTAVLDDFLAATRAELPAVTARPVGVAS